MKQVPIAFTSPRYHRLPQPGHYKRLAPRPQPPPPLRAFPSKTFYKSSDSAVLALRVLIIFCIQRHNIKRGDLLPSNFVRIAAFHTMSCVALFYPSRFYGEEMFSLEKKGMLDFALLFVETIIFENYRLIQS